MRNFNVSNILQRCYCKNKFIWYYWNCICKNNSVYYPNVNWWHNAWVAQWLTAFTLQSAVAGSIPIRDKNLCDQQIAVSLHHVLIISSFVVRFVESLAIEKYCCLVQEFFFSILIAFAKLFNLGTFFLVLSEYHPFFCFALP